jgi:ABC-type lipoprotein export system ATPase subunit
MTKHVSDKHTAAFELDGVCKTYNIGKHRVPVFEDVTFSVAQGEWVSLVGASGTGKTTLLQLLGALDTPTSGTIQCLGYDYKKLRSGRKNALRWQNLGFVFQSYHLFPELNALENVALPALRYGVKRKHTWNEARELLARFDLTERATHRPQELSGGQQQRVALARALINNPDIILADEPTGNLDAESGKRIIEILQHLHQKEGKTIILVTHDEELAKLGERALEVANQRVLTKAEQAD